MKKFKLFESTPIAGKPELHRFDWDLCVLYQNDTCKPPQCPNDTKRSDVGAGYKSLAASIVKLAEIGALPSSVRLSNLDEGDGSKRQCVHVVPSGTNHATISTIKIKSIEP